VQQLLHLQNNVQIYQVSPRSSQTLKDPKCGIDIVAVSRAVRDLLASLRSDRSIWATAPCDHSYRLADSVLFYRSNFPTEALPGRDLKLEELRLAKEELKSLRKSLTTGFTQRSFDVTLGKTIEKVVPGLREFPYRPEDCRVLYEPIDYIVFNGLAKGSLTSVDFVELKSGNANLSRDQRSIRDAVEDHRVSFRRV
jgi:predicted Holliday junction resolvase-like endonuclease